MHVPSWLAVPRCPLPAAEPLSRVPRSEWARGVQQRALVMAGLSLAVIGVQCIPSSEPEESGYRALHPRVEAAGEAEAKYGDVLRQAAVEPVRLLRRGIARCEDAVRDYEGVFVYQQRRGARLEPPSVCRFKFRAEPFSVLMRWLGGAKRVDRLLFVEGQNDGRMVVRPTGWRGKLVAAAEIDPHGPLALAGGSRPITQFGLRNTLLRILGEYEDAAGAGRLNASCLGMILLDGMPAIRLRQTTPERTLLVDLHAGWLIPLRVRKYDAAGRLTLLCRYADLQVNNGFTDATFARGANGLR